MRCNAEAAPDQQAIQHQQYEASEQALLFGVHGKDEVGGSLGKEVELRLSAVHVPLAKNTPRADGNRRLNGVEPATQRIGAGVEQGADSVLLIFVQYHPVGVTVAERLLEH